jgi:hypothetical protein
MTEQVKNIASMSLVDKVTNNILQLGTSREVVINQGITEEIDYGINPLGTETPVGRREMRIDPEIQITIPTKNKDGIALSMGRKWEAVTGTVPVSWIGSITPTRNAYAAQTAGIEGFGVTADPVGAIASARSASGVSQPIIVGTYAGFNPVTAVRSIAFGANGALAISNDLIGVPIAYEVPYNLSNLTTLSEVAFTKLRLTFIMIMTDSTVMRLVFPEVQPRLDNSSLNFGQAGIQMSFRAFDDGTRCVPFDMQILGVARRCAAA